MAQEISYDSEHFGISYLDKTGNEECFISKGNMFNIDTIYIDADTNEVFYDVSTTNLNQQVTFKIPRSDAYSTRMITNYSIKGLDVTDANKHIVVEVFRMLEKEYIESGKKLNHVHSLCGVKHTNINGNDCFVYAGETNPLNGSKYVGNLDIKPKGSFEVWKAMVKDIVKDNIALAFIVSFSFGAILHGILKESVDSDNWIVHLRGESTTGKTTCSMLAISIYGNPSSNSSNGLISSWNATGNALLKRMLGKGEGTRGLLFGLDEFSMFTDANPKRLSQLIYSLGTGLEKDRLTRNANIQDRLTGNYFIISTGEASILEKCNHNPGITMRLTEYDDLRWTASAQQAEKIKQTVLENYGWSATDFGLKVGQYIQEVTFENFKKEYNKFREVYSQHPDNLNDNRAERMSTRYAFVLFAAHLLNKFYDFQIKQDELLEFLLNNEKQNMRDRRTYDDVYEKIVSVIAENIAHFDRVDYSMKVNGTYVNIPAFQSCWGKFEHIEPYHYKDQVATELVFINLISFERLIKQLGYEDYKAVAKYLKRNGYLKTETDRIYCRKVHNKISTKYIALYMLKAEEDVAKEIKEAEERKGKKKRKNMGMSENLAQALAEEDDE